MNRRIVTGSSDLTVSLLGLGCSNFGGRMDRSASRAVIDAAIDRGIDFFDTAEAYSAGRSEQILGEALAGRRHRFVVATKFGYPQPGSTASGRASKAAIVASLEGSLRRLRTDWVDLLQLHAPDPSTPWEDTLAALDRLQRGGKVRLVGASNLGVEQLLASHDLARSQGLRGFVTHQNELSLLRPALARSLLPQLRRRNLGFLPYFPLASGVLTGKYRADAPLPLGSRLSVYENFRARHLTRQDLQRIEVLEDYAISHGRSLLQLAFAWLAAHEEVRSVIAGASNVDQVHANADAINWRMTSSEVAEVDALVESSTATEDLNGATGQQASR